MGKKNFSELKKKEMRAKKGFDIADGIVDCGILLFGMTAGATAIATLMGGTAAIVSDATMSYTAQGLYENDSYQESIREREKQLTDDWINGRIDYVEYKAKIEKLYSVDEVINYSKTANDEKLTNTVESYLETKDFQKTMFTKAVPTFATPAVAGITAAVIAGKSRRKLQDQLTALQGQETEEELAK